MIRWRAPAIIFDLAGEDVTNYITLMLINMVAALFLLAVMCIGGSIVAIRNSGLLGLG